MCKVSSFLGCVPLETFGFFFGWFSMVIVIVSGLAICGSTITFIIDRCELMDRSRAAWRMFRNKLCSIFRPNRIRDLLLAADCFDSDRIRLHGAN